MVVALLLAHEAALRIARAGARSLRARLRGRPPRGTLARRVRGAAGLQIVLIALAALRLICLVLRDKATLCVARARTGGLRARLGGAGTALARGARRAARHAAAALQIVLVATRLAALRLICLVLRHKAALGITGA